MGRKETYVFWWQVASVPLFKERITDMTTPDLSALNAEIQGALTVIQAQLEARGKTNIVWWKKARASLGFISEKKGILRVELSTRQNSDQSDRKQHRIEVLSELRQQAEDGDVQGAVVGLFDFFIRSDRGR